MAIGWRAWLINQVRTDEYDLYTYINLEIDIELYSCYTIRLLLT
jgi:hypothetical protein